MHPSPAPAVALSFCMSTQAEGVGWGSPGGTQAEDVGWGSPGGTLPQISGEICGIESRAALSKGTHIFPSTSWLYPPTSTLVSYLLISFVP